MATSSFTSNTVIRKESRKNFSKVFSKNNKVIKIKKNPEISSISEDYIKKLSSALSNKKRAW